MIENLVNRGVYFAPVDKSDGFSIPEEPVRSAGEPGGRLRQYLESEGSSPIDVTDELDIPPFLRGADRRRMTGQLPIKAVITQGEAPVRTVNLQVARSLDNAVPHTVVAKIRKALHHLIGI